MPLSDTSHRLTPQERAEPFSSVDLRGLLCRAFTLEDNLRDYLFEMCECAYTENPRKRGEFSLISVAEHDAGASLANGVDFATMLDIALKRRKSP